MDMLPIDVRRFADGAGERLDVLGAAVTVKATGRETGAGGGVFVCDHAVPPGYVVPLHSHAVEEEFFLVTEGEVTFAGDEGESVAGAMTCVHAPRGSRHGFANYSSRPARMLVIASPGEGFTDFFRALDRKAKAGGVEPEDMQRIAAEYGIAVG